MWLPPTSSYLKEGHGPAFQVKEVALMHSEGILAGEMKHGPLALVDESLPIIVIATRDRMYQKMLSVVQQLLARGAQLIVLCNRNDRDIEEACRSGCRLIKVGACSSCDTPLGVAVTNVPWGADIAAHLGHNRGLLLSAKYQGCRRLSKSAPGCAGVSCACMLLTNDYVSFYSVYVSLMLTDAPVSSTGGLCDMAFKWYAH
jgi:hypothetical protein